MRKKGEGSLTYFLLRIRKVHPSGTYKIPGGPRSGEAGRESPKAEESDREVNAGVHQGLPGENLHSPGR